MEQRTVFYEAAAGRPPAQDADCWTLIDTEAGAVEVEHRWTRPGADGLMNLSEGVRRLTLATFFRADGSDTAKRRLRQLLETRAAPAA